jgi:pimeloyl-ACP methyl ester carboxylesterase
VSRRRWLARGAVAGGAAALVGGAGYALQRRALRKWDVGVDAAAEAGLTMPDDVQHHYVETDDGGRIHAVERGSGPALVLVHGVTLGVATWIPQLRSLASAHRVIAIGQRGHGQSTAGAGGYSFDRLADDLLEVLERLEVTGAVLVGHSMGGMVSQVLALRNPEALRRHVAGLVLLATSAGPMVPGPVGAPYALAMASGAGRSIRYADRKGRPLLPSADVAMWVTRACFGSRPEPAEIELTRSMVTTMAPGAFAELVVPILTFDVHGEIGAIDLPTKVVVGRRDLLTPPRMARVMARAIPGATLTEYPGCGHMVMLERAEELDELLDRFSVEVTATP